MVSWRLKVLIYQVISWDKWAKRTSWKRKITNTRIHTVIGNSSNIKLTTNLTRTVEAVRATLEWPAWRLDLMEESHLIWKRIKRERHASSLLTYECTRTTKTTQGFSWRWIGGRSRMKAWLSITDNSWHKVASTRPSDQRYSFNVRIPTPFLTKGSPTSGSKMLKNSQNWKSYKIYTIIQWRAPI